MPGHERTTMAAERGPSPHPAPGPQRRPWSLLILLSVAEFMVILDVTVVNVALPSVGRALHFGAGDLQWVVTAYVLLSGGLVLLGGRASDLVGRRRVFLAGLAVFTAASLASGLAPSAGALIAARAGQGLGAALLTPAALSIITTAYSGAQRAAALSTWAALGSGGAAAGVLAGGVLTTWLGWRSVFLVNVPVGVVAGLLSLRLVPRSAAAARVGPDAAAPGGVARPARRLRGGGALGTAAAAAAADLAHPVPGGRRGRDARSHRHPRGHVLPKLALPAGSRRRLGAADRAGVPAPGGGDRARRAPHIAAAAAGGLARARRRRAGADGRGSGPVVAGARPRRLSHRAAAGPAGHRRRNRPGLSRGLGYSDERHRR